MSGTSQPGPHELLSLQEAAWLFDVPVRTLRTRARQGVLPASTVRGLRGREWRVTAESLEAAGLRRAVLPAGAPTDAPAGGEPADPRVAALTAELATLRHVLATERHRADRADRELGHALLECGRLRSALARSLADAEHPDR